MDFMVNIDIKKLSRPIGYSDRILLIGSCFTEHIGNTLQDLKFSVLQNPNGILFDPFSVCKSLISYVENKRYTEEDLFQLNEVWNSWQHHSRFSNTSRSEAIRIINESQEKAHEFLKGADCIIITLGSAFSYRLITPAPSKSPPMGETSEQHNSASSSKKLNKSQVSEVVTSAKLSESSKASPMGGDLEGAGLAVANCHRAPSQWFTKHLLEIDEIKGMLDNCYHRLLQFNPKLNIIFTVSPVRHIRDGVVENNRSKARLIEAVHHMVNKFDRLHYFPAYELVIDVLRDYRFYDIDLVHPNYMATEFVLDKFVQSCVEPESQELMQEIKKIVIARKHKAFQPDTNAHRQFLSSHFEKTKTLSEKYSYLDFHDELAYFSGA